MNVETYWIIEDLIFEEEHALIKQGFGSALAIDGVGDFAYNIIIAKTEEHVFYLKLKFGDRLQNYYVNKNTSMI